jgi:Cupin domain
MLTSASEEIRVGAIGIRFLLEGEESDGSVAVFEFDVPLAGHQTEVSAGEVLCIPRGVVHRFDNYGDVDAKALGIVTPGILGAAYFRELAAIVEGSAGGPPDLAKIAAVMRRHGLTPAS